MAYPKPSFLPFFLMVAMNAFAQPISFKASKQYVAEVFDIVYKKPKGFVDLNISEPWGPGEGRQRIGLIYSPVLQSKDNDCIIMYPVVSLLAVKLSPRNLLTSEITAALGLVDKDGLLLKDTKVDFDKYAEIRAGEYVHRCFNADTVFIAQLPVKKTYREKYNYCTSICLYKKDRPTLVLKLFFTEAGKQHEEEYIGLLCKRIWYKGENWEYDKEKAIKADHDILYKDKYK